MQNVNAIYQYNNTRPNTVRLIAEYLQANNIQVPPWSFKSPDLKNIQYVWDELDRRRLQLQIRPQMTHASID